MQRPFTLPMILSLIALTFLACRSEAPDVEAKAPETETPELAADKEPLPDLVDDEDFWTRENVGELHIGMSLKDANARVGNPGAKSEVQYEGATGLYTKGYTYEQGLTLYFAAEEEDGPFEVSAIGVGKPGLTTARRIGVGSRADEVRTAYGPLIDDEESTDKTIVAGSVYGGILFEMQGGKVKGYFVGAAAE